jgi:hypothetical protein
MRVILSLLQYKVAQKVHIKMEDWVTRIFLHTVHGYGVYIVHARAPVQGYVPTCPAEAEFGSTAGSQPAPCSPCLDWPSLV